MVAGMLPLLMMTSLFGVVVDGFSPLLPRYHQGASEVSPISKSSSRLCLFFAEEAEPEDKSDQVSAPADPTSIVGADVDIVSSDNERFLNMVGGFLVNSFWLNSEHHGVNAENLSSDAETNLIIGKLLLA